MAAAVRWSKWRSCFCCLASGLDPLNKRLDMIETSLVEMRRHLSRQVDYLHDVDHTQECELKQHGRRLDNHDGRLHKIEARKIS